MENNGLYNEIEKPKISVVMATFNGERYVKEQIESILAQTIQPDEIIICDDCSNDKTVQIVKLILDRENILYKLIQHEENKGVLESFYDALRESTGDIIFFSDQDDVWKKNKIEQIYPQFAEKSTNLVFCDADVVDCDLKPTGKTLWQTIKFVPSKCNNKFIYITGIRELLKRNYVTGMCMAIRKKLLDDLDQLSPYMLHDEYFAWKALSSGKIVAINASYILYRQHDNNVVGVKGKRKIQARSEMIQKIIKSSTKSYKKLVEVSRWFRNNENEIILKKAVNFYNWRRSIYGPQKKRKIISWMKYNINGYYRSFCSKNEHARLKDLFLILN